MKDPASAEDPEIDKETQEESKENVEEKVQNNSLEEDQLSGGDNSDSEKEDNQEEEVKIDDSIPLNQQFPMRNTFNFDHLTISSEFDAGNMRKCEEVHQADPDADGGEINSKASKHFDVWISCDGLPYRTSGMRTWFYFYVKGANKKEKIKFTIKNMNSQGKLLKMGLRPVYRVIPKGKYWQRVQGNTTWNRGENGLEIHFQHTFTSDPSERVYFAFTYPYSYVDIQEKVTKIEKRLKNKEYDYIYYKRELLGKSIEERRVDLITLTSKEGITKDHEDLLENCFPEHGDDKTKRPVKFNHK